RREEARALTGTELSFQILPDGTSNGRWKSLPALQTAMLKKALEAFASPRRQAQPDTPDETPKATETGVPERYTSKLGRAFVELIEHLPTDGLPQHGVANATIVITLPEAQLRTGLGEAILDTGTVISTSEVRRLACNAGLIPAVLGSDSAVLDLGRSQRLFDRHQRLALAIRDQGCVSKAHHRIPWSRGGPTDLSNGCLLCSFHHHLIHQGEWELTLAPDGIVEVIPPDRIDPKRRPIRHHRYRPR